MASANMTRISENTFGLTCPSCGSNNNFVVDSRVQLDGEYTRRRRQCTKCDRRFTTHEVIVDVKPGNKGETAEEIALNAITEMMKQLSETEARLRRVRP